MNKKIFAANWKMNKDFNSACSFIKEIVGIIKSDQIILPRIIIIPPFPYLYSIIEILSDLGCINIGAQNCHESEYGAFTGEVSAPMLKSVGVNYVLVGHSERRNHFNETNQVISKKIDSVLKYGLTPIFCCGEDISSRQMNTHINVVQQQIAESLFHLPIQEISKVIIAYEPVWAIGNGITATPEEIVDMNKCIRSFIANKYNYEVSQKIPLLYGGSCNEINVSSFLTNLEINGVLVGGASLHTESFLGILNEICEIG